jgi:hypothetical protein
MQPRGVIVLTQGPLLFARFAFPPNSLGYCGPSEPSTLFEVAHAGAEREVEHLARAFDGAFPYLQLIAAANRIPDPLDRRVVEAYWVGSPLLDRIDHAAMGTALDARFRPRVGPQWGFLAETIPAGAVPHHSFHVFGVYPWVGLLRAGRTEQPLRVLDRCRIRWGTVQSVQGDIAVVQNRLLTWDGRRLDYGEPVSETVRWAMDGASITEAITPGDVVALHWDWVCDRLSPARLHNLQTWTAKTLAMIDGLPHPAPSNVLG